MPLRCRSWMRERSSCATTPSRCSWTVSNGSSTPGEAQPFGDERDGHHGIGEELQPFGVAPTPVLRLLRPGLDFHTLIEHLGKAPAAAPRRGERRHGLHRWTCRSTSTGRRSSWRHAVRNWASSSARSHAERLFTSATIVPVLGTAVRKVATMPFAPWPRQEPRGVLWGCGVQRSWSTRSVRDSVRRSGALKYSGYGPPSRLTQAVVTPARRAPSMSHGCTATSIASLGPTPHWSSA